MRRLLICLALVMLVAGCGRTASPEPTDAVTQLLAEHGWRPAGPRKDAITRMPKDFLLRQGFPWRIIVDYSLDAGLNLEPYAGKEVRSVNLLVEDTRGGRLEAQKVKSNFRAYMLLDVENGNPVGAYLSEESKDGELLVGGPGPSLTGRNLHEITGLAWPQYMQKYRAETPPPEVLAAEAPRNAIYEYFRAAAAQGCDALWSRLAEPVRSANEKGDWCTQYEPVAAIHVIEIQGCAKADTPRGLRFLPSNEVAEEYYVNLEVKHKPGQRSAWQEGHNHVLIPLVRESDGQWRLGVARTVPSL